MNKTINWKAGILAASLLLGGCTANAQHWRHHSHHHPYRTVTVVTTPNSAPRVSNRFSTKDRLAMALAYLELNKDLTIKQYAKMTGLSKESAEAELDAFAVDKNNPIRLIFKGKKKLYVKA